MFQAADNSHNASLKLSEVFSDIGVSERLVMKRRRMVLLNETMATISYRLLGSNLSSYSFGSQSEGSTSIGLHSDTDTLVCNKAYHLIQDSRDWQPDRMNLLMFQDGTTSPGYCLLQYLITNDPLATHLLGQVFDNVSRILYKRVLGNVIGNVIDGVFGNEIQRVLGFGYDRLFFTDRRRRLLMKNTFLKDMIPRGMVFNGPAISRLEMLGFSDIDSVTAFHSRSWPAQAQPWLLRQGIGKWPTEEIKRESEASGCFVVPVGGKSGRKEELEWRISTCLAERYLMFSLNITQIRCYIMMKMILKTFMKHQCNGIISSYMCKNVLFYQIENINSNEWQEHKLLNRLMCCLVALRNCVIKENCPHFIIPENNLMAGKISPQNKPKLLAVLQFVIQSDALALLEIPIDDLGTRFLVKMNIPVYSNRRHYLTQTAVFSEVSAQLIHATGAYIGIHLFSLFQVIGGNELALLEIRKILFTLLNIYRTKEFNELGKAVCRLFIPLFSSALGSMIASSDIQTNTPISSEALDWFSAGLDSDVSSGRLKLASALYCSGDMEKAEFVLRSTEDIYDTSTVEPICGCHGLQRQIIRKEFVNKCSTGNEDLIKHVVAFCVKVMPCEINCCPHELQYEIFGSTPEDILYRQAVADSLPYLYFLQYKVYGFLDRPEGQQCALEHLAATIDTEPLLGHRETALNLLGQCLEQENRYYDALCCYINSLNIRPRNNVAKIHICRLLNSLVNS
ncbi:uncharacterized protein LOC123532538 [Mercenaria mercenaria]|uniref:uncharacterized protein LOC123532538 n=1 Tax=Mercenaria mercenaria TaxID=6596 RepID=UPI00234E72BB|nr:uncharacterized protein LOC123532538 [Mercenaria mercenaria]